MFHKKSKYHIPQAHVFLNSFCAAINRQKESERKTYFSISMQTQKPMKPASGLSVDAVTRPTLRAPVGVCQQRHMEWSDRHC